MLRRGGSQEQHYWCASSTLAVQWLRFHPALDGPVGESRRETVRTTSLVPRLARFRYFAELKV
jgi:hypothetical protein